MTRLEPGGWPHLLLLPGLMCDGTVWADQVEALAPQVASCTVAEYGDAPTIAEMARRALDASPPGPLSIAGHSMGGRVALEIWRQAPERVARLALLDTGFRPLAEGEAGERERAGRMALLEVARRQGVRAMAREWVRGMVHPDRLGSPLEARILDMFERRSAAHFETQIGALLARPDAGRLLGGIAVPVLVLCGREDGWANLAQHEALWAGLPPGPPERPVRGHGALVIEHCGHMSPMEQPEAVTRALADWLRR